MFELKCLTCIHGELCAYKHGGVDLSIISGDCKYYKPTADVVPKSEVERLVDKWIGEEGITQDAMVLRLIEALRDEAKRYEKYYFNHEYDKLIADAKQEVAREIFEEIGKLIIYRMIADTTLIDDRLITDIAELKNKYTESEGK